MSNENRDDLFGEGSIATSERTKWFNVPNLDKGEAPLICKILPPFATLSENPKGWYQYYSLMFGYKDTAGKERPFHTPYKVDFKTKMVQVPCAAIARSEQAKAEFEAISKNPAVDAQTKEFAKKKMLKLMPNKKYYMNIQLENKDFGVFAISHSGFEKLKQEMAKVENEHGLNPVHGDTGVFFKFWKSGYLLNTEYHVAICLADYTRSEQDPTTGEIIKVREKLPLHTPLTLAERKKLGNETSLIRDLAILYPKPSSEEVAYIVSGGPAELEKVLGSASRTTTAFITTSPATATPFQKMEALVSEIEAAPVKEVYETPVSVKTQAPIVEPASSLVTVAVAPTAPQTTPKSPVGTVDFSKLTQDQLDTFLATGSLPS